jgi:hypothetical protein
LSKEKSPQKYEDLYSPRKASSFIRRLSLSPKEETLSTDLFPQNLERNTFEEMPLRGYN